MNYLRLGLLIASSVATASVSANTIACGDYSLTATTVLSCTTGSGNINGNTNGANPDPWLTANSGYIFVDASNNTEGTNNGWLTSNPPATGTSGTFSIDPAAYAANGYDLFAIGFKSNTTWSVFLLADNTLTGSWANVGPAPVENLSHAILYGSGAGSSSSSGGTSVPVPGSLALLGLGLAAVGLYRKKV